MAGFTITDLKKQLGPGLGLRKNKYLLEIPIPGVAGKKLNILCRSTSLPERTIDTVTIMSKGRRYKLRGETNYPGEYEISIVDDSNMAIRQVFDKWLKRVDNTKPRGTGFAGSLGEDFNHLLGDLAGVVEAANTLKTRISSDDGLGFILNGIDGAKGAAAYMTDINIWQLDGQNNKVYGYKLQNAFPTSLGTVTLDDGEENTLSEFSIVFGYSEFIPIENVTAVSQIVDSAIGENANDIVDGIESLFD